MWDSDAIDVSQNRGVIDWKTRDAATDLRTSSSFANVVHIFTRCPQCVQCSPRRKPRPLTRRGKSSYKLLLSSTNLASFKWGTLCSRIKSCLGCFQIKTTALHPRNRTSYLIFKKAKIKKPELDKCGEGVRLESTAFALKIKRRSWMLQCVKPPAVQILLWYAVAMVRNRVAWIVLNL